MSWFSKNIIDPLAKELKNTVKDELKENLIKTVGDCVIKTIDDTDFQKEIEANGYIAKITVSVDVTRK